MHSKWCSSCQGNACEAGSAISVVGGEGREYSEEGVDYDQRGNTFYSVTL